MTLEFQTQFEGKIASLIEDGLTFVATNPIGSSCKIEIARLENGKVAVNFSKSSMEILMKIREEKEKAFVKHT